MILKQGMKHQGMELYKVYVNNDPGMTLTYSMAFIGPLVLWLMDLNLPS